MLSFLTVESIQNKLDVFGGLDPKQTRWIVSDLKSKTYLERTRLFSNKFIETDRVVRARDLWIQMMETSFPEYRIVDECFIEPRLRKFLDEEYLKNSEPETEWAKRPNAHKTLLKYMTYLMPLLNTPHVLSNVREWFSADEKRFDRWGHWFVASAQAWNLLNEERILTPSWLSGFLANRLQGTSPETRATENLYFNLYFDFGADLLPGEADLILALSETHSVTVLAPSATWQMRDPQLFRSYQRLESASRSRDKKSDVVKSVMSPDHRRFSSMLAEVKDAVAQVRAWLESGVEIKDISILAADIGVYWPVLEPHLRVEGIASDRSVKNPLQTLPDFQIWFSKLRIAANNFDRPDLEQAWIDSSPDSLAHFRDFERLYSRFYDPEDVNRHPEFAKLILKAKLKIIHPLSFAQFFSIAENLWPSDQTLFALENLLVDLQNQGADSPHLVLSFQDWVTVIEATSARIELNKIIASPAGLACLDASSAEYFPGTHLYILGLSEDALRRTSTLHVLDHDVTALSEATGFDLPFPESRQLEWEIPWLLHANRKNVILSFPETNFDGSPLTPSTFWLRGSLAANDESTHQRRTPAFTRWDEIQHLAAPEKMLNWSAEHEFSFSESFGRERKKESLPFWQMEDWKNRLRRFSPSLLQRYSECPFIVLNERIWGQKSLPDLDLDIDHMTKGKLLHRIFETILASGSVPDLSLPEVEKIVRQSMSDIEIEWGEPQLRGTAEKRFTKIAHEFLKHEREWRKKYPQTKTIGRELAVDGWIDLDSGELYKLPPDGAAVMAFRGQIDRVDQDENHHLAILDYKSSGSSLNSHNVWIKNNQLQLSLYMEAVQSGMTDPPLESKDVVAAQYFVMKDFSRTKGLVIHGPADHLVCLSAGSKARITEEQYESFRVEIKKYVATLFGRMKNGEWTPEPRDKDECPKCQWRGMCRAPHLI